jgi:cell division protein FtsB
MLNFCAMKELFGGLWKVAPQLMSVVVVVCILFYGSLKVSQLYLAFESMNERLTKLEVRMDKLEVRMDKLEARMDRVEQKLDLIIEYILEDREKRNGK